MHEITQTDGLRMLYWVGLYAGGNINVHSCYHMHVKLIFN